MRSEAKRLWRLPSSTLIAGFLCLCLVITAKAARQPEDLVLVLDNSASMRTNDPRHLVEKQFVSWSPG